MYTNLCAMKNNNSENLVVLPTTSTMMRTVYTIIFSTSSNDSAATSSHYPISDQLNANSSSQEDSGKSELRGENNNIGSILLPETSVFYALRTVSTIVFSNSDSATISSNSFHANSFKPLNAEAIEVKEDSVRNQSKWKRGKLLGQEAFGSVYKGFNSETRQICVIKEVLLDANDDRSEKCLQQLCQEKNILSQLSHPNIVKYYGSELGDEGISIYMEYVSCGSIYNILQKYGPLNENYIQYYTKHRRNIVHRDIKGANILINPDGEIKLADFGMARYVNPSSMMHSFKGSLYWMALEMVNNKNGYTIAVDIWSLEFTITEMATKKPPWSQYKREVVIAKIGDSKDLPTIPNQLSKHAKSFIRFCLQKDPMAPPSIFQLLDHPFV